MADTTIPASPPLANSSMNDPEVTLHVNRLNIQDDFIGFFKNPDILYIPLKMQFKDEMGFDVAGVSREGYTAFWASFYLRSCEGEAARVPIIVRKFEEEEWKSVGTIIAKGYLDHKIFPNMLAPAFMVALIHGESAVSTELLMESFFDFVAPDEKSAIKTAWDGEQLSEEDSDDLLDVLERLGSSTIPSEENMKSCMRQVAHKRIIREPRYALDNVRRTCREPLLRFFPDVQSVRDIYIKIAPSAKKVNALFRAEPATQSEAQSLKYLKQFIKGLTVGELRRLLRFFTGSEVISVSHIDVSFTHLKGLQRRIIAHTCGPTIELPSTYTCYPDLRAELQTMLEGDCFTYTIG